VGGLEGFVVPFPLVPLLGSVVVGGVEVDVLDGVGGLEGFVVPFPSSLVSLLGSVVVGYVVVVLSRFFVFVVLTDCLVRLVLGVGLVTPRLRVGKLVGTGWFHMSYPVDVFGAYASTMHSVG
jgi:hypothetical protein